MNHLKTVPELATFAGLPPSAIFSSVAGYRTDYLLKDAEIEKATLLQTDATCSIVLADEVLHTEYTEVGVSQYAGIPLADLFTLAMNPHMPQDIRAEMALVPGMPSYTICEFTEGKRLEHRSNPKSLLLQQAVPKLSIHFRANTYLPTYKKQEYMHATHINLNYLNFRSAPFNVLPLFDFQTFVHSIFLFTDRFNYYVAFNEEFMEYYNVCMNHTEAPHLSEPLLVPEMDDFTITIDCSKVGRLISRLSSKNYIIFKDHKWQKFADSIAFCHFINGMVDIIPEYAPEKTMAKTQELAARMQNLAATTSHMALIIEDGEEPLELVSLLEEAFGARLRYKPDMYLSDSILGSEDLVSFLLPDMIYDVFAHEYLYLPGVIGNEESTAVSAVDAAGTSIFRNLLTVDGVEESACSIQSVLLTSTDAGIWENSSFFRVNLINSARLARITGKSKGVALAISKDMAQGVSDSIHMSTRMSADLRKSQALDQERAPDSLLDQLRCTFVGSDDQLGTEIRKKLFGISDWRWNALRNCKTQAWAVLNRSNSLAALSMKAFSAAAPVLTKDYIRVLNWAPSNPTNELAPSFLAQQPNARAYWLALRVRSYAKYLLEVAPDIVTFQCSGYAELLDSYLYENEVETYTFIHTRVCPQWPFVTLDKTYIATLVNFQTGEPMKSTQKCPFAGHYTTETSTIAFNSQKYELLSYDNIYLSNVLSMPWLNEALPSTWRHFLSDDTATICLLKSKKMQRTFVVVLSISSTRTSDPAKMIQVLYAEYYLYLFVQKQVKDRKINLATDSVIYVLAGHMCGGTTQPTYRLLTGGNRWTSLGNELAAMETSYATVKQALKQYDDLQCTIPEVEEEVRKHNLVSYESLFATIICEKSLLDLVCRSSNLVRVWSPVTYGSNTDSEAKIMWDSDSYDFYLAGAEEDKAASAKLAVFGIYVL